jgi:hypothetical protein
MGSKNLLLVRARWDGTVHLPAAAWPVPPEFQDHSIMLAADPNGLSPLYIHLMGTRFAISPTKFYASDAFPIPIVIKPHPGCNENTLVLQYGPSETVLVGKLIQSDGRVALAIRPYGSDQLLPSVDVIRLAELEDDVGPMPLPCFVRGVDCFVGYGRTLHSHRGGQVRSKLHGVIRNITGSHPHTRARIVVGCVQGGVVVWGHRANAPHTPFAMDLYEPLLGINRGGWIAAVTRDCVQVYDTHEGKLSFVAQIEGPKAKPIAVLSTSDTTLFAVVTEDGVVLIYEVSPKE